MILKVKVKVKLSYLHTQCTSQGLSVSYNNIQKINILVTSNKINNDLSLSYQPVQDGIRER